MRIDTGILSFRAGDEPYAVTYDSVLAAIQWGKAHTRRLSGPPAPPAPANAPPPVPDVERRQAHVTYWLTTVYETRPPGGNVLEQGRLDFIKRVETAVTSIKGFDEFCKKVPTQSAWDQDSRVCSHWVPPGEQDSCSETICSTPMSLVSFEQYIRTWFQSLASQAASAPNATVAVSQTRDELMSLGFSHEQADEFANALVDNPTLAQTFGTLPLVELLKLVPKGALTKDVFRLGHEPGWFFDRWYATGVSEKERDGNSEDDDDDDDDDASSDDHDSPPPHAVALRSGFEFALPLAGYATASDRREVQDVLYRQWAKAYTTMFEEGGYWDREAQKAGIRVLHAGGGISEDEASQLVLGDLKFAAGAFVLVFLCILAYVRSFWITTNAVLGVALAFPASFFFIRANSNSPFVSFLNVLVPFVLIGIGCDDAMVMCDAFKAASIASHVSEVENTTSGGDRVNSHQVNCKHPTEANFADQFASAAKAMLATSLTTAVAFGSNIFSYIPPVRALGLYAAATVVANYVLVLTLLPAALLIKSFGFQATFKKSFGNFTEILTGSKNTKYQALGAEVEMGNVGQKKSNFSGHIDGTGEDEEDSNETNNTVEVDIGVVRVSSSGSNFSLSATIALGNFVIGQRLKILASSVILVLIASIVVGNGIQIAETPPALLRPDTNLQRIQHLLFEVFYTENWSNVKVAFGVKGVDRSSADPNDPMSFGSAIFDEHFRFETEPVQRGVLAACEVIKNNKEKLAFTPSAGPEECAVQAFVRDFLSDEGNCPYSRGNNSDSSDNCTSIPWGAGFPLAFAEWSRDKGRAWRENLGWFGMEGTTDLVFLTADYYVNLHPVASTSSEIREVHSNWKKVLLEANDAMERAMREAIEEQAMESTSGDSDNISPPVVVQACDVWNRMGVEESIQHTAAVSPPVSAAAAGVIMYVATGSVRVTLAALLTIACAVVLMLASLVAAGWEFGVVEELCVTLLIGSSIDYCIHLAVAYAEAEGMEEGGVTNGTSGAATHAAGVTHETTPPPQTNKSNVKVQRALQHSAPTITGAAATTAASCAMLLLCKVEVLVKIGATIVANTVVGYVLTLFLFSSLVATVGD